MKRNKFSLSHYKLLTCDMGELIPIGLTEVLPGDTIQHATSALIRVSPLMAPVMHPVQAKIHHWFVPFTIIWDGWEEFITGGPLNDDPRDFPFIELATGGASGSLADYLGIPSTSNPIQVSALPFRAYAAIWNEHYRDQDLQTELVVSKDDGEDETTNRYLQLVNWEKDYFTTCRPFTQKGDDVVIPIGTSAPITGTGTVAVPGWDGQIRTATGGGGSADQLTTGAGGEVGATALNSNIYPWIPGINLTAGDIADQLTADLSTATAATVLQLREAFALQRYAEARAKYGSRYTEYLRFLGVKSSDGRLQRPEYLGGGKQTLQFSEILQTGPDTQDEGVGNIKGHGIGALRSNRYRRFFEEHGYIVSMMSVTPKTMYGQGIHRTWNRRAKEHFFQKELQHIGQQEVLNKELYADHTQPDAAFGYQDRYDEYRRAESSIAGDFRDTMDHWHMCRLFGSEPVLNGTFVQAEPTKRIHAVQSEDVLWVMANHSMQARRMVSR